MIKGREIKNMFLSEEKEMFASICFFFFNVAFFSPGSKSTKGTGATCLYINATILNK